MHEWGDPGITAAVVLAIGIALLLSWVFTQQARTRAARYKEIRRLQSLAAEEARREEEEALAEYNSMVATQDLHCSVCSRLSTTRCSRCKAVRYCSSTCQIRHWKDSHRLECRPGQAVPSSGSSSNGSRNFSDIGSSSGSSRGGSGSRTLSEVVAAPAESARAIPVLNGNGTSIKPRKILFPYDCFVKYFNWEGPKMPPCGLLNCGNSCFANVVLQCLTYTRPLIAYLLEGTHGEECRRSVSGDWCFMCELQDHVWRVKNRQSPISPIKILSRIRNIGNHLGYGKQEDAHEFMRCAIDSLQSICLDKAGGEKSVDPRSQETTFIQYIFGGHLQSQVKCMQCLHESNRYENMLDLAVEIQGCVETLEDALAQFTAPEWLDGENKYKCDRCNAYVKARKRLTLHEAPNVLTIALKRFQSGKFGKLNKRVTFPELLDVSPYMSGKGDTPPLYKLYAVVVHVDMLNASFFGHYICYVKDSHGVWYKIDDSKVKEVDLEKVMAQKAYMLFYTRSYARPPPFTDGAVSPYPVGGASDVGNIVSDRHGDGGARGLHALADFNQLVDYVDGSPGTQTDSEHSISNGDLTTLQPRSWDIGRFRSNDDEIELEDAGCIATSSSSSSITQTSPYVSRFTSKQGLWIPTKGIVRRGPASRSVGGIDELYGPKSSLRDDFSEVTLQPRYVEQSCNVEQTCNSKIGKRRLEDGLSPLPSPKPLDTDQLPAWPSGSQRRPNACALPVPQSSGTPISCSMSDDSEPTQLNFELDVPGEPLSSGTLSVQHRAPSDVVFLPVSVECSLETESANQIVAETDDEISARAKRQHVEINLVDPIVRVQRPHEAVHAKSCDLSVTHMDWDAQFQHPRSLTSEAVSGPVADSRAGTAKPQLSGHVVQHLSLHNASQIERDEIEEPHQSTIVVSEGSEIVKLVSQPYRGLEEEFAGALPCLPDVIMQTRTSQSSDQIILEQGSINQEAYKSIYEESSSITDTPAKAVQADNVVHAVPDKLQPGILRNSKSTSKPLFAPGFLNKARPPVESKLKSRSIASIKGAAGETGQVENVDGQVDENSTGNALNCPSNVETPAIDVRIVPEGDLPGPSERVSPAGASNDTPAAPTVQVSSCGNSMNCEGRNPAHFVSQTENGGRTEGGAAPDMKESSLSKNISKSDRGSTSSKARRQNMGANGNTSSLNYPPVSIDDEPPTGLLSEAVAGPCRPTNGKQKQGRNETCNCGSQQKWKKCCGRMGVMKPEVGRRRLVV